MSDAIWQLQQAVYATLSGDSNLSGQVTGVHGIVPEDAIKPYLLLEKWQGEDWSTSQATGEAVTFEVVCISASRSSAECLTVLERVKVLLHLQALSVFGHVLYALKQEAMELTMIEDGAVIRGRAQYRALLERE